MRTGNFSSAFFCIRAILMKMTTVHSPKVIGLASNISPDGLAGDAMLSALIVELVAVETPRQIGRIPTDAQLIERGDMTVFMPVDEPGQASGTIDVHGHIDLGECTGVLIVRAGGKTFTKEFHGKANDYAVRLKFDHFIGAGLTIYTEVLVERDLTKGKLPGGFMTVDSIDFTIKPAAKAAAKKAAKKPK